MGSIEAAFDHLDGGSAGGGVMNVSSFADDELHPYAQAFEKHWRRAGFDPMTSAWPGVGIVRVRSNRDGWSRHSAAGLLEAALARPNVRMLTHSQAVQLRRSGGRVSGVVVGEQVLSADEVILCAGTLGTAELLARSGVAEIEDAALWEHREQLVRFTPRGHLDRAGALLQTVLHTRDGLEVRCYNDDFAQFIDGLPPSTPAFGVALMKPEYAGSVSWDPVARLRVDLGEVSAGDSEKIRQCAERVVSMLDGERLRGTGQAGVAVDRTGGPDLSTCLGNDAHGGTHRLARRSRRDAGVAHRGCVHPAHRRIERSTCDGDDGRLAHRGAPLRE